MNILTVLSTEFLKLKRTTVLWVLAALYMIAPFMMALMMAALKYPELGRRMGLLTTKAQLTIGGVDWPTYFMLTGFLFAGGIILMGIVQAFLFGREYIEGTAKNLLTLPVERAHFIVSKLIISALWFTAVAIGITIISLALGFVIGLPGYSKELLESHLANMFIVTIQVICISSIPAWLAVATKGFIAPLGLSILFLLLGDFAAHTSWGIWFPWSIILLKAGAVPEGGSVPGLGSMAVMLLTFSAGFTGTLLTLEKSDNTQ